MNLKITVILAALAPWMVWSAPPIPPSPNPAMNATGVPVDVNLRWAPGDQELIRNGGFESGTLDSWTAVQEGFIAIANVDDGTSDPLPFLGTPTASPPIAGNFSFVAGAAQFGGGAVSLFQEVTIPAGAASATLSWVHQISNYNPAGFSANPPQRFHVTIRNLEGAVLAVAYLTQDADPSFTTAQKRQFDVSDFAGQTVRLFFVIESNVEPIVVHVDNISVRVNARSITSYDVFFGTNTVFSGANLLGNTTNTFWDLPQLLPDTTYFWRLTTRGGGSAVNSPTWQFRTGRRGAVDRFSWEPIGSPQTTAQPVPVMLTARDAANNVVTGFSGPVTLSASMASTAPANTLLDTSSETAFVGYDRSTVGYSFTPSSDLVVTHVRHFSGDKVSVWSGSGRLLRQQTVQSANRTWRQTALEPPLTLQADQSYRVGVYSANLTTHYARFDRPAAFAHGTLVQSYTAPGDAFPDQPHAARWWFIDLVYQTVSPHPVTPSQAAGFVNGTWTGTITIPNPGSHVSIRAEDGGGHVGVSNPFEVAP